MADFANDPINKDLLNLPALCNVFLAGKVGQGMYRRVYQVRHDATLVLKVCITVDLWENTNEYNIWQKYGETQIGQYLCPSIFLSNDERLLIARKAEDIDTHLLNAIPDEVKSIIGEQPKLPNWGIYDGRVVCRDYGIRGMEQRIYDSRKIWEKW